MTPPPEATYTVGSGNIFAYLNLPDADMMLAKSKVVVRIHLAITRSGMSYQEAAEKLGIRPGQVKALLGGKFFNVSLERLIALLEKLGGKVLVTVTDAPPLKPTPQV